MIGFLTVVHILIAVALCALVLVQDSKGGGALGIGGSGSNSLLGATGAQSLASKLTRYVAILFAVSCVGLTYFLAHENKSVVDQLGGSALLTPTTTEKAVPAVPATSAGTTTETAPTTAAPQQQAPATDAAAAKTEKAPTTSGQPAANDKK